jgi:hypothetical protein
MSVSLAATAYYTLIPLVLAVQVVRARRRAECRPPGSGTRALLRAQSVVGLALIAYAAVQWLQGRGGALGGATLGVGVAGLGSAWWDDRYLTTPRADPMAWFHKHMECMVRVGIAYHTVFAVFVLTPWLGRLGWGAWALAVPAVLPTAAGLPALWFWGRHYRRPFAEKRTGDGRPDEMGGDAEPVRCT